MIEKYTEVLKRIEDCQESLDSCKEEIKIKELEVKDASATCAQLSKEKTSAIISTRESVINEEIRKTREPLEKKKLSILFELNTLQEEHISNIQRILETNYNILESESFNIINESSHLVNSLTTEFDRLIDDNIRDTVATRVYNLQPTDNMILNLFEAVAKDTDLNSVKGKVPLLEKMTTQLLLPTDTQGRKGSAILQIALMILKGSVIATGLMILPIAVVVPYSAFLLKGISTQNANNEKIQKMLYPYEMLKQCTIKHRAGLIDKCNAQKRADIDMADTKFEETKAVMENNVFNIEKVITDVPVSVSSTLDEDKVQQIVEEKYASKLKESKDTEEILRNGLSQLNTKQSEESETLEQLKKQKTELKRELESTLIDLEKVGTNPMLLKSFFLGFDENENVTTLDYSGESSFIMYSGANSTALIPFINMMIIQYFTNMQINNLHIDIVDLENAGTPYDVFSYGCLKDVINVVATTQEQGELIKLLHKDMRSRSLQISAVAENIEAYNTIMLGRDSIPLDYRVILLQAPSKEIFRDIEFLQLCRQGAKNGIIIFVFVNSSTIPKLSGASSDLDTEEIKSWEGIIDAVPSKFFNFNSETSEVTNVGLDFKTGALQTFKKLLKGVK